MAVHIALHEIGVPFESQPLSMAGGATRTPEFLAINPEGKVPSWAIDRYSIADIHLFRLFWRFWNTYPVKESEYPELCAHYDRMMARPAVQQTCAIEAALGYELRGLTLRGR